MSSTSLRARDPGTPPRSERPASAFTGCAASTAARAVQTWGAAPAGNTDLALSLSFLSPKLTAAAVTSSPRASAA